ncbi:MAG: NAD(P)H-hydrate dehydratase [Planctomycetes bacterium]|nr:NAD(P)H-hydrate dehydratase [Planctomycetota bacterium]
MDTQNIHTGKLFIKQLFKKFPSVRPKDTHKGDYGKIGIIAGSYGMAGAAILCANSCLKSGAGLVYLIVPDQIYNVVAGRSICSVIFPMETKEGRFGKGFFLPALTICNSFTDIVCLGPGIGQSEELKMLINQFILQVQTPLILDADGINLIDAGTLKRRTKPTVITPHVGEFSRLSGKSMDEINENRVQISSDFAKEHNLILVLKGNQTIVTDGTNIYINKSGNPGMATGGSGDCLTGMIGAIWAQMKSAFESACLAVYIHGLAGDISARELTEIGMTAEDIMNSIPKAFKSLRK